MSFELNRRLVARRPPLKTSAAIDPVTASIINGAFETVCFEVATHLGRAASSAIINQSNERNASIIDAHGRLAGISVGIPQLLFISPLAVRAGQFEVVVDARALTLETMHVSAGERGMDVALNPRDLVAVTGASIVDGMTIAR